MTGLDTSRLSTEKTIRAMKEQQIEYAELKSLVSELLEIVTSQSKRIDALECRLFTENIDAQRIMKDPVDPDFEITDAKIDPVTCDDPVAVAEGSGVPEDPFAIEMT